MAVLWTEVAKDLQLPSATAPDGHLQIGNLHVFLNDLDTHTSRHRWVSFSATSYIGLGSTALSLHQKILQGTEAFFEVAAVSCLSVATTTGAGAGC
jgi:hypothetical protein